MNHEDFDDLCGPELKAARQADRAIPVSIRSQKELGIVLEFAGLNRTQMIELACRRVMMKDQRLGTWIWSYIRDDEISDNKLANMVSYMPMLNHFKDLVTDEYHTLRTELAQATT